MNNIPRRAKREEMVLAERMFRDIVWEVEDMGADPLLTEAIVLLNQAQNKIADFVDKRLASSGNATGDEK